MGIDEDYQGSLEIQDKRDRIYSAYKDWNDKKIRKTLKLFEDQNRLISKEIAKQIKMVQTNEANEDSLKRIFDIDKSLPNAINQMGALNLKISRPEIFDTPAYMGALDKYNTQNIFENASREYYDLVKKISSAKLPEPFYSDALQRSGLNSRIIHSPTFDLPHITPYFPEQAGESRGCPGALAG